MSLFLKRLHKDGIDARPLTPPGLSGKLSSTGPS